jgi:transcription elongation GreA/GreB family factor
MHSDVVKLVEAGRIPKAVGERLTQLSPGNFCLHKAWGSGKIVAWDLLAKTVTIDFADREGQQMDLQFAIQKTEWLPKDDFRSRKLEEIEELRQLATSDPIALVVHLLHSHGGSMTLDAMDKEISGAVVPTEKYKKWWDSTKKALRESKRVIVPAKRTELLVLRAGDMTPAEALVADFEVARDLKAMAKALEAISSDIRLFDNDQEALRRLLVDIDEAARKGTRLQLDLALQLLSLRDEVIGGSKTLELDPAAIRLSDVLATESSRLPDALSGLPTARQRAIYESFPAAFGDAWISAIFAIFDKVGPRGVAEIARFIVDRDELPALREYLSSSLTRRALGPDALIWVCRERHEASRDVFCGEVGSAILNLLEIDHLDDGPRKTTRLQSLLTEDKKLISELVAQMDVNEARNFGRRLMECPVFGELDRKSLMARVIKARPETGELVSGDGSRRRNETFIVSWPSLERKQNELDDLIRNRIPQNTKDISIARSYGDLRENFEYKSSKDLQKVLMRRKGELEREVDRARGTDFKGADTASVNIGTIVTLVDPEGTKVVFSVLGAWDSDPEKQIVSYLSEIGAALIGAVPGQTVAVRDPRNDVIRDFIVESIAAENP